MHHPLTKVVDRALVRVHQLQSDLVSQLRLDLPTDPRRTLEQLEEISQDLLTAQAFLDEAPPSPHP